LAKSAIQPGQKVLLIDDLIATGGTACAGVDLVRQAGGIPVLFVSVLDVPDLPGRAELQKLDVPSFNLIDNP
jgi:adenine phosphoribosyltransferase